MKVYLAGPMRGISEFNFPAFFKAEKQLTKEGHSVFNPARRDEERYGDEFSKKNPNGDETIAVARHKFNLRKALGDDLKFICQEAEAIALLPGWQDSKGAKAERAVALALGLKVILL